MKPQMFLFVMLPHTERFAVLEVARAGEFSLLKNAPSAGTDDSVMSRRNLIFSRSSP
jgi:UDP-N-acetylglucosamine/UDP-N-acetylgalactosamine diphosphorylase